MFAYELTSPHHEPTRTTSAGRADAIATALVNTHQTPVRYRIYWALGDGTVADIAADVPIPAEMTSPGAIADLRRAYERSLRARITLGQLSYLEERISA